MALVAISLGTETPVLGNRGTQKRAYDWPVLMPHARTFYRDEKTVILHQNFLKTQVIKSESVDLIVTSPPYNVDISYNNHNDKLHYEKEYLPFTRRWLAKCFDVAKNGGRLCLNIPLDKNKGGQRSVYADITYAAQKAGWEYHCTIVWNEQNISRRTAWGSWKSASAPFIIAPVEMIAVFYKGKSWRRPIGEKQNDLTTEEFLEWTNGVWSFSGEKKTRVNHPAPFPVELPRRCIKLFSFVGDTVFDPFLGSGTTLIACLETNRKGIGSDIDRGYCALARDRVLSSKKLPLHQTSEGSLNHKSLHDLFVASDQSNDPPTIRDIARILAKVCELPSRGVTRSGRQVHMPSLEQVTVWVEKKLKHKANPSRKDNLPTNRQVATVLSKILKKSPQEVNNGESAMISADQIRLWIRRHT